VWWRNRLGKLSYSDLCIYLADCLKDVDKINVNWRVLMAYLHGFENDNKVEVKVTKLPKRKMTYEEKCRRYGWNPKDDTHV